MKIFTVSELNYKIEDTIDSFFKHPIMIKGEITGAKTARNNQYCDLVEKTDEGSFAIPCAILAWENLQKINLTDYNSSTVLITGKVNFYRPFGKLSIKILEIELYGEGALKKKIELVRRKLEGEGLFDRKRKIPSFPKIIGLITSEEGDAVHDVSKQVRKRYPLAEIHLYPSLVQGDLASKNIIKQIKRINFDNKADVLLVVRGGGNLQNLMPFNDENLAREIYASNIPTITGIGHAPDITIADYICDLHTNTPTDAGISATPDKNELYQRLDNLEEVFIHKIESKIQECKNLTEQKIVSINSHNPENLIKELIIQHTRQSKKIEYCIKHSIHQIGENKKRINLGINQSRKRISQKFQTLAEKLHYQISNINQKVEYTYGMKKQKFSTFSCEISNSNPKKILKKGYSIIRNKGRKIIKSKIEFNKEKTFSAEFHDGETIAEKH